MTSPVLLSLTQDDSRSRVGQAETRVALSNSLYLTAPALKAVLYGNPAPASISVSYGNPASDPAPVAVTYGNLPTPVSAGTVSYCNFPSPVSSELCHMATLPQSLVRLCRVGNPLPAPGAVHSGIITEPAPSAVSPLPAPLLLVKLALTSLVHLQEATVALPNCPLLHVTLVDLQLPQHTHL